MRRAITRVKPSMIALPAAFVLLWSSGYISGTLGVWHAPALALTFYRFVLAAIVITVVALVTRAPWPKDWRSVGRIAVVGVLFQAVQFIGVYLGMGLGVSAGLAALIVSITPLLVAVTSVPLFGQCMSRTALLGSALGLTGVIVAVSGRLEMGHLAGIGLVVLGLLGMAGGTLYQEKTHSGVDLRTGSAIQFTVAAVVTAPVAAWHDGLSYPMTVPSIGALIWIAIVNSIGGTLLLFGLIRRSTGSDVTSYLYLVPAVTAILAVPILGQTLTLPTIAGLATSLVGVVLFAREKQVNGSANGRSGPTGLRVASVQPLPDLVRGVGATSTLRADDHDAGRGDTNQTGNSQ